MSLARALVAELGADEDALDELLDLLESRRKRLLVEPEDGWLNAESAARRLDCTTDRIYDLVQVGKLAPSRDGRRLLFRAADLDAYVASDSASPTGYRGALRRAA
jgi:excisionase family DNA binding protein